MSSRYPLPALKRMFALLLTLALLGTVYGCSSGGSSNNSNNNGGGGGGGGNNTVFFSTVTGRVTDPDGAPLIGATVTVDSLTTQTTQFGNFRLPNVQIAKVEVSRVLVISAQSNVNGVNWTGSNVIEIFRTSDVATNAQLVVSDPATQGEIQGVVRETDGTPIGGASIYASVEIPPANAGDPIRWANLGAFLAISNANGAYILPDLPNSAHWYLVASYPGRLNTRKRSVVVNPGTSNVINFTLNRSSGTSTVPVAQSIFSISLTYPDSPTRAAGNDVSAIRQYLLKKKGFDKRRIAKQSVTATSKGTRAAPAGSHIENIVTWDFAHLDNLYGYVVLRSINIDSDFKSYGVLQDALADRFSDADSILTPDLNYYYSVSRLDTINFPLSGAEGDPVIPPTVCSPLQPIALTGPVSSATVLNPVFSWTGVNRASLYQILVYDRFPTLQSSFDVSNGVTPIWPQNSEQPGTSLVPAGRTSQAYQGPALISGRRYYWTVIAADSTGAAYTISPISSFIAQ